MFLQAGIRGNANSVLQVSGGDTGRLSGVLDRNGMTTSGAISGSTFSAEEVLDWYNNRVIRTRVTDTLGAEHEVMIAFRESGISSFLGVDLLVHADEYSGVASEAGTWRKAAAFVGGVLNFNTSSGATTSSAGQWNGFASGAAVQFKQVDISGLKISDTSGTLSVNLGQSTSIDTSGVESIASAKASLDLVLRRLESLSLLRGTIGAAQSRLNVASALNQGAREASSAAESRIRDVDVASESAELVAQQIRQKSATSVLQYANSQPKILLSLLSAAGRGE